LLRPAQDPHEPSAAAECEAGVIIGHIPQHRAIPKTRL
jgi:hypothetical protein